MNSLIAYCVATAAACTLILGVLASAWAQLNDLYKEVIRRFPFADSLQPPKLNLKPSSYLRNENAHRDQRGVREQVDYVPANVQVIQCRKILDQTATKGGVTSPFLHYIRT